MSLNDASRITIDDYIVMLQIVASLTDNSRDAIYNCNMLIVKVTGVHYIKYFGINLLTLFVSYIKILYKRFFLSVL